MDDTSNIHDERNVADAELSDEDLADRLRSETDAHIEVPTSLSMAFMFRTANVLYKRAKERKVAMKAALDHAMTATENDGRHPWRSIDEVGAFADDFTRIRIAIDRALDDEEIRRVGSALDYALRSAVPGDALSDPSIILSGVGGVVLEFVYDSSRSERDDPDFGAAFWNAHKYIESGTPILRMDRAGTGSLGTRLVSGIGIGPTIRFYVG